jgi:hypothetical protein
MEARESEPARSGVSSVVYSNSGRPRRNRAEGSGLPNGLGCGNFNRSTEVDTNSIANASGNHALAMG